MTAITSAPALRTLVASALTDAAELGTADLHAKLSGILFATNPLIIEEAAHGTGDQFPAELATLHSERESGDLTDDGLAFKLAMALYAR